MRRLGSPEGTLTNLRGSLVRLGGPLIRLRGPSLRGPLGGWVGYLVLWGPWLFGTDSGAQGLGLGLESGLIDLRC